MYISRGPDSLYFAMWVFISFLKAGARSFTFIHKFTKIERYSIVLDSTFGSNVVIVFVIVITSVITVIVGHKFNIN